MQMICQASERRTRRAKPAGAAPSGMVTLEFICIILTMFMLLLLCFEITTASVRYGHDYFGAFQLARAHLVNQPPIDLVNEMEQHQPVQVDELNVNENLITTVPKDRRKLWTSMVDSTLNARITLPIVTLRTQPQDMRDDNLP